MRNRAHGSVDCAKKILLPFRTFRKIGLLADKVAGGPVIGGLNYDDGTLIAQRQIVQIATQLIDAAVPARIVGKAHYVEGNMMGDQIVEEPDSRVIVAAAFDLEQNAWQGLRSAAGVNAANPRLKQVSKIIPVIRELAVRP